MLRELCANGWELSMYTRVMENIAYEVYKANERQLREQAAMLLRQAAIQEQLAQQALRQSTTS